MVEMPDGQFLHYDVHCECYDDALNALPNLVDAFPTRTRAHFHYNRGSDYGDDGCDDDDDATEYNSDKGNPKVINVVMLIMIVMIIMILRIVIET